MRVERTLQINSTVVTALHTAAEATLLIRDYLHVWLGSQNKLLGVACMDGFYLHAGGGLFPASATANTRGDQRHKHFEGKVQLKSLSTALKSPIQ